MVGGVQPSTRENEKVSIKVLNIVKLSNHILRIDRKQLNRIWCVVQKNGRAPELESWGRL